MRNKLNEGLPSMIPTYPVTIAGQSLTLRFDVNVNRTKKGVKLQFVLKSVPEDPRELQNLATKIGAELQTKFGAADLQIIYDVENPYKNVIGFLVPLTSIASFILKDVFKGSSAEEPQAPKEKEEAPKEELPEKPLAEKRIRFADLLNDL